MLPERAMYKDRLQRELSHGFKIMQLTMNTLMEQTLSWIVHPFRNLLRISRLPKCNISRKGWTTMTHISTFPDLKSPTETSKWFQCVLPSQLSWVLFCVQLRQAHSVTSAITHAELFLPDLRLDVAHGPTLSGHLAKNSHSSTASQVQVQGKERNQNKLVAGAWQHKDFLYAPRWKFSCSFF